MLILGNMKVRKQERKQLFVVEIERRRGEISKGRMRADTRSLAGASFASLLLTRSLSTFNSHPCVDATLRESRERLSEKKGKNCGESASSRVLSFRTPDCAQFTQRQRREDGVEPLDNS